MLGRVRFRIVKRNKQPALLLLGMSLTLASCSRTVVKASVTEPLGVPVNAAVAVAEDVPFEIAAIGTVEAINSVEVKSRVADGSSNEKRRFWINGKRSVILAVRKQPGANTIEVSDRVKALVLSLRESMPPGVSFGKVADDATTVRESIAEVNRTLLLTICLVILVIFAFLGSASATLIASVSIPVSILGTFVVMRLLNYSVDMFSMMAITLSVGFIVDDSIVMIENIVRHREMGKTRRDAAVTGAREVGFTIVSMTVSLVAVFLPVLFLGGVLGRLLREFAVTISVAILLSGVTSLTLTPMLCSRFLRSGGRPGSGFRRAAERMYAAVERFYERTLNVVLRHRRVTLMVSFAMTALTVDLFVVMPKSFMPAVDVGYFNGSLEASQDTSFERMVAYGEQVNEILATTPGMESTVSGMDSQSAGWFHVNLSNDRHRPKVKTIMAAVKQRLDRIPGLNVYLRQGDLLTLGENEGRSQYSAALEGPDAQELYHWAPLLKAKLQALPELANVSSDLQMTAPRVVVDIERDLAVSLNVDPGQIANTLYDAYGNRRASAVMVASERHDVILEVAKRYQRDPEALGRLFLRSTTGRLVPLSAVTTLRQTVAPLTANHVGQFPAVTFQFDLKRGRLPGRGDRDHPACGRGSRPASDDELRVSRDSCPVSKLPSRVGVAAGDRGDGHLSGAWHSV